MKTHPKKRLEIIIEAPALSRLLDFLDGAGVTGYTVVPAVAGRGHEGSWRQDGGVTDASRMMVVTCIADPARVDGMLEPLFKLVTKQIGIVGISDIDVLRPDHF